MKIIVTVKTGKGNKSSEAEIDKTAGVLEQIILIFNSNFKNYEWIGCKAMPDGTQIILEKN